MKLLLWNYPFKLSNFSSWLVSSLLLFSDLSLLELVLHSDFAFSSAKIFPLLKGPSATSHQHSVTRIHNTLHVMSVILSTIHLFTIKMFTRFAILKRMSSSYDRMKTDIYYSIFPIFIRTRLIRSWTKNSKIDQLNHESFFFPNEHHHHHHPSKTASPSSVDIERERVHDSDQIRRYLQLGSSRLRFNAKNTPRKKVSYQIDEKRERRSLRHRKRPPTLTRLEQNY